MKVLHDLGDRLGNGNLGALRCIFGNEQADGTVVPTQIAARRGGDLLGRVAGDPVPLKEDVAPVAERDVVREGNADLLVVVEDTLRFLKRLDLDTLNFLRGRWPSCEVLDLANQGIANRLQRITFLDHGAENHQPRCIAVERKRHHRSRLPRFDQSLVQPAGGRRAQDVASDFEQAGIGM